jgi:hypothetical protein
VTNRDAAKYQRERNEVREVSDASGERIEGYEGAKVEPLTLPRSTTRPTCGRTSLAAMRDDDGVVDPQPGRGRP